MSATNDLNVALVVQAQTAQARAQLAQVKQALAGVGEASAEASAASTQASAASAAAAKAEAAAIGEVGAAQAARAETEAEAVARIHDMVQASKQATLVEQARAQAARDSAAVSQTVTAATAEQRAATAALTAAQTASMQAYTYARAPVLALQQLLQKSKLTTAEVAEADSLLDRAQASGVISAGELAEAFAALDAAKIKDTEVTQANTAANIENGLSMNSRSRREVGTIAAEGLSGNFGRVRTSGLALANDVGAFQALLSPAVLTFTATIGALVAAYVKGQTAAAEFNRVMLMTGQAAGVTYTQMRAMAESMTGAGTSIGEANEALMALATTGKFAGDQLGQAAQAAVDMAHLTGDSVGQAVAAIVKLREDPVHAIEALDEQYHFLSTATLQRIQDLEAQGDKEAAANVAEGAYASALRQRATEMESQLGALQKVWRSLGESASWAWDQMQGIGRPNTKLDDLGAQYDKLLQFRMSVADRIAGKGTFGDFLNAPDAIGGKSTSGMSLPEQLAAIDAELAKVRADTKPLQDAANAAAQSKADAAALQQAGNEGVETLAKLGINLDGIKNKQDKVREAATALWNVWRAGGQLPAGVAFDGPIADVPVGPGWNKIKASLLSGSKGPNLAGLETSSAVAQAQQIVQHVTQVYANGQKVIDAQHKAGLVSDAAYWDAERGMLAEWENDKVAALEAEKAAAQSHIKTAADRIRADQQVAKIDGEIATVHADAAAKRMQIDADEKAAVDKTAQAWLQLRASLGLPVDMDTAKAMKKLQDLYALLQKLKDEGKSPSDAQVGDMVGAALMTGVSTKQPTMRSAQLLPDAARKNDPLAMVSDDQQAEQAWFTKAQAQLAANYKAAQNLYAGNTDKLLQIQTQYQAKSDALAQQDAARKKQLDQAKYWAELDTAQTVLGQLAQLSASHNRKIAMVGKAAAIAQAVITTYKNATIAYGEGLEAGGPYAGPALGAVYAAIAVAAGIANVAAIRAQPVGQGYSAGGYTGNSPVTQAVGLVHGREGVLSAPEVESIGGEAGFNNLRAMIRRGYADGGYVSPYANAPTPEQLGFSAPSMPSIDFGKLAANDASMGRAPSVNVKTIIVQDNDALAQEILNTPTGTKIVVQHVANHGRAIRGKWGSG